MVSKDINQKKISRILGSEIAPFKAGHGQIGSLADAQRLQQTSTSPFPGICEAAGLPRPVPEYRFARPRQWRFDWAFEGRPNVWSKRLVKVALEIEGGVWARKQGRHNRGSGFVKDMEKYNEAAILGWRVLRVTTEQFARGDAVTLVRRAFGIE